MKLHVKEARTLFIEEWSNMSINWGTSRSLGQVHAFLLLSTQPVTYEDIRGELNISQGNANNMMRDLLEWGLVRRVMVSGERKEYFIAEKDMFKVAQLVAKARKRRELDPLIETLSVFKNIDGPKTEVSNFTGLVESIKSVAAVADTALTIMDKSGVVSLLKKLS